MKRLFALIASLVSVLLLGLFIWNIMGQSGWFDNLGFFSSHAADNAYNSGTEYLKQEQYNQAIVDFDAAIRLDPEHASAYYNRAYAYDELDRPERATEDYTEIIRLDPEYAAMPTTTEVSRTVNEVCMNRPYLTSMHT